MTTAISQIGALEGGLRTPGSIRTKLAQVNADVAAFTADVARSSAPETWKVAYTGWLSTWGSFYVETSNSWWAQQWGDTYTQAERFETRLSDWRADFTTKGYGGTTAPPVRLEQFEGTDWGTVVIWAAVLGAVGAGLYFGWPLIVAKLARGRQAMAGLEEDCGCGG